MFIVHIFTPFMAMLAKDPSLDLPLWVVRPQADKRIMRFTRAVCWRDGCTSGIFDPSDLMPGTNSRAVLYTSAKSIEMSEPVIEVKVRPEDDAEVLSKRVLRKWLKLKKDQES